MKKIIIAVILVGLFTIAGVAQAVAPKIYVQWAQSNPNDWSLLTISTWGSQPTKADPVGDTTVGSGSGVGDFLLNNQKGWVFSINVQGVTFDFYDHYQVIGTDTSVTVTAWRDDPLMFPVGERMADVGIINVLKFDAKVGQENTDQTFIWYREGTRYDDLLANGVPDNVTLRHYSEFVPPTSNVKAGIYVSDAKYQEHLDAQTQKGWR